MKARQELLHIRHILQQSRPVGYRVGMPQAHLSQGGKQPASDIWQARRDLPDQEESFLRLHSGIDIRLSPFGPLGAQSMPFQVHPVLHSLHQTVHPLPVQSPRFFGRHPGGRFAELRSVNQLLLNLKRAHLPRLQTAVHQVVMGD